MRNVILGTIAGLLVGTVGATAYSHFLGDGALLADLQAKLDVATASASKADSDKKDLANETTGLSDQVNQLQASNADLKQKLETGGIPTTTAPAAAAPAINPMNLMGTMMGAMRGMQAGPARMFLLQTRLHLKPDQAAAIKTAMDADEKARRDLMGQAFRNGGKIDPAAAAAANTTDKVMASLLDPDQARAYTQLQTEEKNARADTAATMQINQFAPLLQLSDSQKDQVFNSLYQTQLGAPDMTTMMTNPSSLVTQAQTTNTALSKVLTTDQMALYTQEGQLMGNGRGGARGGRPGGGNGPGGNGGGGNGGGGNGGNTASTTAPTISMTSNGAGYVAGQSTMTGYVTASAPGTSSTFTTTTTPQVMNSSGAQNVVPASTAPVFSGATGTTNAAPLTSDTSGASSSTTNAATTNAAPAASQ